MTSRQHTVTAVILVLTGLYLMRLSGAEIQPWDEGLYAVRAQSIVEFNAWWDQTPHALGGLYSSTAPPFVPWLVALSISVVGPSATGVRLPIVLCSAVALLMMYLIARRMVTFEHSLLAVCVLAGTMHWALFARLAMTEVPLMMWCLVALWSTLAWNERREAWWPAAVFGVALGMALLTKMLVSLVPLAFLAPLIISQWKSRRFTLSCVIALVIAALVAAPWYMMMASTHDMSFFTGIPVAHLVTDVENNTKALGPLFYINQLVIGNSVLAFGLIFVAVAMIKRHLLPPKTHQAAISIMTWFVISMLILSLSVTKNVHYTVMLLPPAVLLSVYAAERMLLHASRRLLIVSYGIVSALAMWAILPPLHRQAFRTAPFDTVVLIESAILALVIGVGFVLPRKRLQSLALQLFKPVLYGVVALFLVRTSVLIVKGGEADMRGGRAVAAYLLDTTVPSFTYLYHKRNDGDALNPQLAWYLDGWMAGWMRGRSYIPVALPEDGVSDSVNVLSVQATSVYVVYLNAVRPQKDRLLNKVRMALAPTYRDKQFEDYTLFTRRH